MKMPQTGVIVFGGYVQGLSYTSCLGKRGVLVAVLDNYASARISKQFFLLRLFLCKQVLFFLDGNKESVLHRNF